LKRYGSWSRWERGLRSARSFSSISFKDFFLRQAHYLKNIQQQTAHQALREFCESIFFTF
jgi:uncharacterized protein with NAD-binding domain and iron-sulfur cluster